MNNHYLINDIINSIDSNHLDILQESIEIECKLATGKDGRGGLPSAFWESYSAFANTNGGVVVLGVKEKNGQFEVQGIVDVAKVKKELFDNLNNKKKVSTNLLSDSDIHEWQIDDKTVMLVAVPRAKRTQQPIHLTENPYGNTFIRQHEGDYRLDDDKVNLLIAEKQLENRDDEVLEHYTLDDLDLTSVQDYRQIYTNLNPNSPFNSYDTQKFLQQIGAYGVNRSKKIGGITKAGLLMFGQLSAIQDIFPNYFVDYREHLNDNPRWSHRLALDGNWSGNLFDFYRHVAYRLPQGLDVPFALKDGIRQDETPVHDALREALVNCLIHANYADRMPILVEKYEHEFCFSNPGTMRISAQYALEHTGSSDCRNRKLQQMFRLIKICEQAGTGIQTIHDSWVEQHWQKPTFEERREPNHQTLVKLKIASLYPQNIINDLMIQFGQAFDTLSQDERVVLATIKMETTSTNTRLQKLLGIHPTDITKLLRQLIQKNMLQKSGKGTGTVYMLANTNPSDLFSLSDTPLDAPIGTPNAKTDDSIITATNPNTGLDKPNAGVNAGVNKPNAGVNAGVDKLFELSQIPADEFEQLLKIAKPSLSKSRLQAMDMQVIILALCQHRPLGPKALAVLLNRTSDTLRKNYLKPLTSDSLLSSTYPDTPNHPQQTYFTTEQGKLFLAQHDKYM
ncbi:RNA-binding domain-containing protein [Moraxella bovis]|uniref:RNA-binding domain-containing protein n=1 Tax=Moraxella bovis TaxID=476 RepID=UPI0022270C9B|nr:RNA-binding domain-containing protein [Moraxella bovis]UZA38168.1 putative DNA binding domain-containing protein [Moraxella bovis]